jgi:hypothetical protein
LTEFLEAVSTDGRRVLEAELGEEDVQALVARARARDAELLWLHADADLATHGFERFPGYVRMRGENPVHGEPLPLLEPAHYPTTLDAAYRGLWGHKLVSHEAEPPPGALVLGLYEHEETIGLCTVFADERLVDGPGVRASSREPAAYARLLLGACAALGPGPVELDSWGDSPAVIDAYCVLGFAVVERTGGWQLRLE